MINRTIEIMDTTLRDGEQTSGVSFSISEKLTLSRLLLGELNVDRIEIASARVSAGELNAVKEINQWAKGEGLDRRIEVLGFVDGGTSIEWMIKTGAKVQNQINSSCEFGILRANDVELILNLISRTPSKRLSLVSEYALN